MKLATFKVPKGTFVTLSASMLFLSQVFAFDSFSSQLLPCPVSCSDYPTPEIWTHFHEIERLAVCKEPLLLDFAIYNPVDDPNTQLTIRACTKGNAETTINALTNAPASGPTSNVSNPVISEPIDTETPTCVVGSEVPVLAQAATWGASSNSSSDVLIAARQVLSFLEDKKHCNGKIVFGYSQGALVGVHVGSLVEASSAAALVQRFIDDAEQAPSAERSIVQICGNGRNANHVLGVVADASGEFSWVQNVVKSWIEAECVVAEDMQDLEELTIKEVVEVPMPQPSNSTNSTSLFSRDRSISPISARADCRTIDVAGGDSCAALATRCGISGADFTKYNTKTDLCSTLMPGQSVCCSSGTLPDKRPKMLANGTCYSYVIQGGDSCYAIAATWGLEVKDLNNFNNETWGWPGCEGLLPGVRICLSSGKPAMPAPVTGVSCGPTKPGTLPPTGNQKLEDLSPCPLKACCNIWGNCGTTADFCLVTKSASGNPGTAKPGTNGCVQNCGMELTNNKEKPDKFIKVGYFGAWNGNRPCLRMSVTTFDTDSYTHLHYSFAEVTDSFGITIEKVKAQWEDFKAMTDVKKILAFGGWDFSTMPATYQRFRDAVKPANRDNFANACVKFVNDNNLDGLDFDWEYPSAPDIPDIPMGSPEEGQNYLEFLELVRSRLPSGKSLSIAAPASYWYLKGFPIEDIAKVVDYIVYMTYDLHGQWDYSNQWATPGCPAGNCLRSHVNLTETLNALVMITKAGVPTKKIVVGVTSYGRSFKMTTAGCTGEMCTYTGKESGAKGGMCTGTPGYLANAEINEIIRAGGDVQTWFDQKTESDYMVYEGTEWVAYMSDKTKQTRIDRWENLNFGGTTDWAVDLQEFGRDFGSSDDEDDGEEEDVELVNCGGSYNTLDDISNDSGKIPPRCIPRYILAVLKKMLADSLTEYNKLMGEGYDGKFTIYADLVAQMAPGELRQFLLDNGDTYFTCSITEEISCCRGCYYEHGDNSKDCQHCTLKQCEEITSPWGVPTSWENKTEPCPPDYSKRGLNDDGQQTITWTFKDGQKAAFYDAVLEKTGIEEADITIAPRTAAPIYKPDTACIRGGFKAEYCYRQNWWIYEPRVVRGYDRDDVSNPKTVISDALSKLQDIQEDLAGILIAMELEEWMSSEDDVVDALSLPVLMVEQAVASMKEVIETADEIQEQERKSFILNFLSAILFLLPIAGGAVATISASVGRIILLMGEAGNLAMGIHDIVENPKMAPFAIFGLIIGAQGLRDIGKIGQAAKLRHDMTPDQTKKLSEGIAGKMTKIDDIMKSCRR